MNHFHWVQLHLVDQSLLRPLDFGVLKIMLHRFVGFRHALAELFVHIHKGIVVTLVDVVGFPVFVRQGFEGFVELGWESFDPGPMWWGGWFASLEKAPLPHPYSFR